MNFFKSFFFFVSFFALTNRASASSDDLLHLNKKFEKLSSHQKELYKKISNNLRCPTCTGVSVLQSDALFSIQIRNAVIDQVKTTKDKDSIVKFFTDRYGLWILREPPWKGFHQLAWLVPLVFFLVGVLLLWFFVSKKTRKSTEGLRPTKDILFEFDKKIERKRKENSL